MKNPNCRNCGAPLEAGSIFCIKCGLASAEYKRPNNTRHVQNNDKRIVFTVLIVTFFVLAVGILTAALILGKPISAMQKGTNAINPGKGQGALSAAPSVTEVDGNWNCTFKMEKVSEKGGAKITQPRPASPQTRG